MLFERLSSDSASGFDVAEASEAVLAGGSRDRKDMRVSFSAGREQAKV